MDWRGCFHVFSLLSGRIVAFDRACFGHFHTPIDQEHLHGNGCMKGGDEYAIGRLFVSGRPSQTMLYVHPKHGVVGTERIYLDKNKHKVVIDNDLWQFPQ